jgi:hypothetical protein
MPYTKDIGHSPVYIARYMSRSYTPSKVLYMSHSIDIPHTHIGNTIMFKDIYEAHIIEVECMTPRQRFKHIYF